MSTLQTLLALVVLIYVLSVIVQAVQEALKWFISLKPGSNTVQGLLKGLIKSKAGTMRKAFDEFMGPHLPLTDVEDALQKRGLDITALESFSKEDFRHLLDGIGGLEPRLAGVVDSTTATFEQKKENVAAAFEGALARFQSSYTKYNKRFAKVLSFIVVLALNANLILLYEQLAADQVMSQAIAGTADRLIRTKEPNNNAPSVPPDVCQKPDKNEDPNKTYENTRDCIKGKLKNYPILVRWKSNGSVSWFGPQLYDDLKEDWFNAAAGLVLMWALVSLGAPFWNNVLKGAASLNKP